MENTKITCLFLRAAESWPTFDIQISMTLAIFWESCKTALFRKPTEVPQNTPTFISIEPPILAALASKQKLLTF